PCPASTTRSSVPNACVSRRSTRRASPTSSTPTACWPCASSTSSTTSTARSSWNTCRLSSKIASRPGCASKSARPLPEPHPFRLIARFSAHHTACNIPAAGRFTALPIYSLMRLVFAGTPEFARIAYSALCDAGHDISLVLTQPDRPAGRGLKLAQSPVKAAALADEVQVLQPRSLRLDGKFPDDAAMVRDALDALKPEPMLLAAH